MPESAAPGPRLAVVVGAAGGVGRALAERLAEHPAYDQVVGLSRRRPEGWDDGPRRRWLPLDILDEDTLRAAAGAISDMGAPSRVVVATGRLQSAGRPPEKSLRAIDPTALMDLFAVNAVGPALAAKHLLPLAPRDRPSLFAALSARVGSIGDNRLGGWYGYRASKAALNMVIRTLAIEHRRTHPLGVCVALHPGTVDTALSRPFGGGPARRLTPDEAAESLLSVMEALGPNDSGGFFAWDGAPIPW